MTAYADGILAGLLRSATVVPAAGSDWRVYTRQPADLAGRLPCIVVRAVQGGIVLQATADGARSVPWQMDVYTADTGDAGHDAHSKCRAGIKVLVAAARSRTVTADGYLTAVGSIAGPYDAADAATPGGVCRWQATGLAGVRKPF